MFLTSALDGLVKLWDMRNEKSPLSVLKRATASEQTDAKVFGLEWNGGSQILSGGSESHISVHEI